MFIFLHSITTNIRTIRREVFEYSNNIRIFKVARIRIRIVIFVKNYSNIRIIRIFVTTLVSTYIQYIEGYVLIRVIYKDIKWNWIFSWFLTSEIERWLFSVNITGEKYPWYKCQIFFSNSLYNQHEALLNKSK